MQTRRGFLGVIAATACAAAVPKPLEVVRATTDCDLVVSTLVYAMGVVGTGPYRLRVPPEGVGRARLVLSHAFVSPERYRDFEIKVERIDEYTDSWALDNGRRCFYTAGA